MIVVKMTAFLILLSIVYFMAYAFLVSVWAEGHKLEAKMEMYPSWIIYLGVIFILMMIIDCIGAVFSMFWVLFLR